MACQQSDFCIFDGPHRLGRGRCIIHGAAVLVHQRQRSPAQDGTLVVGGRDFAQIGPDRALERVTVHGNLHIRAILV